MAVEYMTAAQAAEKWNISQRRVQVLCAEGRLSGVFKLGSFGGKHCKFHSYLKKLLMNSS